MAGTDPGFKIVWHQMLWRSAKWNMVVQADPSDNSTPKLGLKIEPWVRHICQEWMGQSSCQGES
jgi:hypothetical protein